MLRELLRGGGGISSIVVPAMVAALPVETAGATLGGDGSVEA